MAKTLFLNMGMNTGLKAELQQLANEENRTLRNFIETELWKISAAPKRKYTSLMPPRQARAARLTICINAQLKTKLQLLASEDYRNLPDFIETRLLQSVSAHKAKRKSRDVVIVRKALREGPMLSQQPRDARISMRINAALKADLQGLANEQYRTLTDLVENEFHRIVAARNAKRESLILRRQERATNVTMRMKTELKARLQQLASEQYRTVTDFIEIELRQIVAARRAKRRI